MLPAHERDACRLEPREQIPARTARARVGDGDDLDPGVVERKGRLQTPVGRRRDDGRLARTDPVERGESLRARAQHHPGQIVALEHQRLLDRAGGRDVALGSDLVQRALRPDGHDAVEVAERCGRRQHLDPGGANALRQLVDRVGAIAEQRGPAELRAVVGEHHVGPQLGGAQRGAHAGDAAADHEHVRMATPVLGTPLAVLLAACEPAQPGRVAEHLLVERPQAARPDEGLVVEARRGQVAAEDLGRSHDVEAQGRPGVHVLDLHPLPDRLRAGAHAGPAVHVDEAVRALTGAAEQAARAVVLEAPREDPMIGRVQRRADRVARERLDPLAVEGERDGPCAVDPLAAAGGEAAHRPGRPTHRTSLVVVSRSARNHARHPER